MYRCSTLEAIRIFNVHLYTRNQQPIRFLPLSGGARTPGMAHPSKETNTVVDNSIIDHRRKKRVCGVTTIEYKVHQKETKNVTSSVASSSFSNRQLAIPMAIVKGRSEEVPLLLLIQTDEEARPHAHRRKGKHFPTIISWISRPARKGCFTVLSSSKT